MLSDFQQCGILTRVDSNEPVQPPFRHFYPQADTLRVHLTLTLLVQCIVHLRSTF